MSIFDTLFGSKKEPKKASPLPALQNQSQNLSLPPQPSLLSTAPLIPSGRGSLAINPIIARDQEKVDLKDAQETLQMSFPTITPEIRVQVGDKKNKAAMKKVVEKDLKQSFVDDQAALAAAKAQFAVDRETVKHNPAYGNILGGIVSSAVDTTEFIGTLGQGDGFMTRETPSKRADRLLNYIKTHDPESASMYDQQHKKPTSRAVGDFVGEMVPAMVASAPVASAVKGTAVVQAMLKSGKVGNWLGHALISAAHELPARGILAAKHGESPEEFMKHVVLTPSTLLPYRKAWEIPAGSLATYAVAKAQGLTEDEALKMAGTDGLFGMVQKFGFNRKLSDEFSSIAETEMKAIADKAQAGNLSLKETRKMMDEGVARIQKRAKEMGYIGENRMLALKNQDPLSLSSESRLIAKTGGDDAIEFRRNTPNTTVKPGDTPITEGLKNKVKERVDIQGKKLSPEQATVRKELIGTDDGVADLILQKRGIITAEEAANRAKGLNITEDDILNIPKGKALNVEQQTALRQTVQSERDLHQKLKARIAESTDPTEKSQLNTILRDQTIKMRKMEMIDFATRSESARTLQSLNNDISAVDMRMRSIYKRLKNKTPLEQEAMMKKLGDTDIDDPKQFMKFIETIDDADFFDKASEYITAGLLWNPPTHIVNFVGNATRLATDIGVTAITQPRLLKADLAGAANGLFAGVRSGIKALTNDGYAANLSKYIEAGGSAPAIKGMKGTVIRTPFRALAAADEVFSATSYQRSLYRQAAQSARSKGLRGADYKKAMQEFIKSPSMEAMEKASKQAKRMTFQEDMGEFLKTLDRLRSPSEMNGVTGKTAALATKTFLPFLKTPSNLIKQAADFSPAGFLKNAKLYKADPEEFTRRMGEAVLGTAALGGIYGLMESGSIKVNGAPPPAAKKAERDQWERENKIPYSVEVGGKVTEFKRMEPFGTVLSLFADVYNMPEESKETKGAMMEYAFNAFIQQMRDKTFLKGLDDFTKIVSTESWERKQQLESMPSRLLIPSIVGHTARSIDKNPRETDSVVEHVASQIPFLSKELPAKINVFGFSKERENKGFNYFFNPIRTADGTVDPVTKNLAELKYYIPLPANNFVKDNVDITLTPDEYENYATEIGQNLYYIMNELVQSDSYKGKTKEDQIKYIKKIRDKLIDVEKDKLIKNRIGESVNTDPNETSILDYVQKGKPKHPLFPFISE